MRALHIGIMGESPFEAEALTDALGDSGVTAELTSAGRISSSKHDLIVIVGTEKPLAFIRDIRRSHPRLPVACLLSSSRPAQVRAALAAGAQSVIPRSLPPPDLVAAIRLAGIGLSVTPIPPTLSRFIALTSSASVTMRKRCCSLSSTT